MSRQLLEPSFQGEAQPIDGSPFHSGGSQRRVQRASQSPGHVSAPTLELREPTANPPGSGSRCDTAYGVDPGQCLVQDERQGVQVGRLPHLLSLALLGCHICERPQDVARPREHVLAGEACPAEVGQLGRAAESL